jgi:hypothetical protein
LIYRLFLIADAKLYLDQAFADTSNSTPPQSPPKPPSITSKRGPDRRHLEKIHKRVNGDDGLEHNVIEPYHAPLLHLPAEVTNRKAAVQLKVVTTKQPLQANSGAWQTVLHAKKSAAPSVKPFWGQTTTGRAIIVPPPPVNPWGPGTCDIPELRSTRAPAVQHPAPAATTAFIGSDCFISSGNKPVDESTITHAIVSQKKAKKHEREARRKKKKKTIQQEESTTPTGDTAEETPAILTRIATFTSDNRIEPDVANEDKTSFPLPIGDINVEAVADVSTMHKPEALTALPCLLLSPPVPVVHNSKHMHWVKFKRQFIVDQLTSPFHTSQPGCSHSANCVFETNDVPDCPFHEPCKYMRLSSYRHSC